ncbi:MAG: hypothetical protein KDK70_00235 [Myxococcales bacterium]|nr:hypothetical protein [Myxococcales bacterium]
MLRRLPCSSLVLALLLVAPACIINSDDGDSDSGNDSNPTTTNSTNSTNATNATSPTTGSETDDPTGDTTAAGDTTAGSGPCGWGPTGDDMVPEGYVCGGDGVDPDGMYEMACPEDVTLEAGGECGTIEGPGCCDPDGNAWFCGDAGSGPELAQIVC